MEGEPRRPGGTTRVYVAILGHTYMRVTVECTAPIAQPFGGEFEAMVASIKRDHIR